jgi:prolyl-tRNA synthetase
MRRRLVLVLMLLTRASAVALVAPRLTRSAGGRRVLLRACATEAPPKPQKKKQQQQKKGGKGGGGGLPGLTARDADYSAWYNEVIAAGDLVDGSPVKGCMVIKPNGMALWEAVRDDLDARIKATGCRNAYFPLFIPVSFLSKEAEHVEGFAKECAVVTHHRLRSTTDADGKSGVEPDPGAELEEPLIVRPTSETMIWHMFGKWIQGHRDLPLKINQWANVVRWELRTRPFLRSAEFLWQEGHTAHATEADAVATAEEMIDVYADLAKELLAIPTVRGLKSPTERFAGAEATYTIEALMQNNWALQSGTSHFLGQNFARAFDVNFQNADNQQELVWATSWGVSTRLIGALVMTHSDDAGLVLPPAVAPTQVVVVPISPKGPTKDPEGHAALMAYVDRAVGALKAAGVRVDVDDRFNLKPGPKFYEAERRGIPLRIECGPRDIEANSLLCARRTGGDKFALDLDDGFAARVVSELDEMQAALLAAAEQRMADRTIACDSYAQMKQELADGDDGTSPPGWWLVPWCDDAEAEEAVKKETKATIRCFPLQGQEAAEGKACFYSGKPATHMALFARAF